MVQDPDLPRDFCKIARVTKLLTGNVEILTNLGWPKLEECQAYFTL